MHLLLSLLLWTAFAQTATPADVSRMSVAKPSTLVVVDSDKIKGEPWRLAWSPDGSQLHLAAMKRNGTAVEMTHYLIDTTTGALTAAPAPEWAAKYWEWKSWKAAPGNPALEIALDQQRKNVSATARPMGGDLARGGGSVDPGTTVDAAAGQNSTNLLIVTMMLKGQILGRWEGEPIVPGLTFGWGPEGTQMMAFAGQDGRLMLLDEQGRTMRVDGTRDVRLPAWSFDAARLAWVEKQDRKKDRIQVAAVARDGSGTPD